MPYFDDRPFNEAAGCLEEQLHSKNRVKSRSPSKSRSRSPGKLTGKRNDGEETECSSTDSPPKSSPIKADPSVVRREKTDKEPISPGKRGYPPSSTAPVTVAIKPDRDVLEGMLWDADDAAAKLFGVSGLNATVLKSSAGPPPPPPGMV